MNWFKEYISSLKRPEAEEVLDILLFRPIGFVIVKTFYRLPITPNMYSLLALISGIFSAIFFAEGNAHGRFIGAWFFFLFAVLDCCDGMCARMKKNGSPMGRIIDGLVDYTVNAAVYITLVVVEIKNENYLFATLFLTSGLLKAFNSGIYDHYLTEYLNSAEGESDFAIKEYHKTKAELLRPSIAIREKIAKNIYLFYTWMQLPKENATKSVFDPKTYCKLNVVTLKMWGIIGPAVHILVLIVAMLFNEPMWLFTYCGIFGIVWMLFMFMYQKIVDQRVLTLQNINN